MNGIAILGIAHKPALVIARRSALVLTMLITGLASNPTARRDCAKSLPVLVPVRTAESSIGLESCDTIASERSSAGGTAESSALDQFVCPPGWSSRTLRNRCIVQFRPRPVALVQTSPSNAQTPKPDAQNKPEQPRPIKRVSPIDAIRRHLQRLGYTIDESKSTPGMIVSSYSDARPGKVTIVMIYDKRKEVVDFYIYNFGNVAKAADRGAIDSYLLSANDAIIIGGFFVDKDGDIGYKYVSTASQLSLGSFEVIYVTMAGVALDRRPEIRKLIETGKLEAPPNKDSQI